MHEIKFRGFDLDLKQWFYGGYHRHIKRQLCPIEVSKQEQNWAKDLLHKISIRLANLEDNETNNIKNIKREVAIEIINIIEKHAPDSIDPASEAFKVIEEIISKFEVENE